MQYTVKRASVSLGAPDANWERVEWRDAETLEVTHFPWPDSGHRPRAAARVLYDDRFLAVIFRVEDRYVRAVAENFQDSVCLDSCAEFTAVLRPRSAKPAWRPSR